jgi:predicted alpha/beta-hydrolase family hydrolase
MGGRVGCHVALEESVSAIVCLGYPLKGGRQSVRDEVLLQLDTPILFVQGSKDTLCPLDLLAQVRDRMTAPNDLVVVDEANHSLEVPARHLKTLGQTQEQVNERILAAVHRFLNRYVPVE